MLSCSPNGCGKKAPPEHRYRILFTSRVQGALEPCGCTADPLGGIGRIASIVSQSRSDYGPHQIFVDGGNLLFSATTPQPKIQRCQYGPALETLGKAYEMMGATNALIGPKDLPEGRAQAEEFFRSYQIAPFNASHPITLEEKIAVFGLEAVRPESIARLDAQARALREKNTRFVIAFVQGEEIEKALLSMTKHVDLFVLPSPENGKPIAPYRVNSKSPYMIEGGNFGEYVGTVDVYLPSEGPIKLDDRVQKRAAKQELFQTRLGRLQARLGEETSANQIAFVKEQISRVRGQMAVLTNQNLQPLNAPNFSVNFVPVARSVPQDPAVKRLLEDYEVGREALVSFCEKEKTCPKLEEGEASYVGVQSCLSCHQSQYEFWQKAVVDVPGKDDSGNSVMRQLGHSRAWETLEEKGKTKDPTCIGCHSIGYDKPGGYCKVNEVDFRKDVQCESCHGPGSKHAATGKKEFIKRMVPESTCRNCHHVPHIPTPESFNYNESLLKITGPGHGVDLFNQLAHR